MKHYTCNCCGRRVKKEDNCFPWPWDDHQNMPHVGVCAECDFVLTFECYEQIRPMINNTIGDVKDRVEILLRNLCGE